MEQFVKRAKPEGKPSGSTRERKVDQEKHEG